MCVANVLIAPMSAIVKENYYILFLIVFGIKLIAFIIALTTIPEIAAVPEQTARTYSFLLYGKSITGYRVSVEISRDTILLTLRLIGLTVVLLSLYIIYRILLYIVF